MPMSTPAPAPHPALPRLAPRDIYVPRHTDDDRAFVTAWAAHVEAGRIGVALGPSPEQAARHARNAMLACPHRPARIW